MTAGFSALAGSFASLPPLVAPRWWRKEEGKNGATARCGLCVHRCTIPPGGTGVCGVRGYTEQGFVSPYLGRFCSQAVDPIEKKPLYHWQPGTRIFSLGSLGCNMRCPFCQNHSIAHPARELPLASLSPRELVDTVRKLGLASVAYTYNEPALQAEYILEAAPLLREAGIATVLVTNGMFSAEVCSELIPWVAAANVDVKTFNKAAYAKLGGSLAQVRETVASLVRGGVHVEATILVVPGISDSPEEFTELTEWLAGVSPDIPLHISRYFPAHQWKAPATPVELLRGFAAIAETRLRHVHLGNVR